MRQKKSIDVLTSLRGIAALLVVSHHMGLLMLPLHSTLLGPALGKLGLMGMSIFFVLSGFVIHYNYADLLSEKREAGVLVFLFARLARLFPLYLVFIVLNYLLNEARAPSALAASTYTASLPAYLVGMQSWFYSVVNGRNMTEAQEYANNSWSISTEIFLYILYIPLALRYRFSGKLRYALLICLVAILGRFLFIVLSVTPAVDHAFSSRWGVSPAAPVWYWLSYLSPYGRFWEFLAGVGIAEVWRSVEQKVPNRRETVITFFLALISACFVIASLIDQAAFSIPKLFSTPNVMIGYAFAIPVLIFALCRHQMGVCKPLCSRPMMYAGEMSYSLYLLHSDLWPIFKVGSDGPWSGDLVLECVMKSGGFLVALFGLSWFCYRFFEIPARRAVLAFFRKATGSIGGVNKKTVTLDVASTSTGTSR